MCVRLSFEAEEGREQQSAVAVQSLFRLRTIAKITLAGSITFGNPNGA